MEKMQPVRFKMGITELRAQAHHYFDMLWQHKYIGRNELYVKLSEWLEVPEPKAHMSRMNPDECKKTIEYSVMMLNDMRRLDMDFGAEPNHPYFEIMPAKKRL